MSDQMAIFRKLSLTLFMLSSMEITTAIQINYIKVPGAVRNDSKRAVIMDCDYSVRPGDNELVVKWFLNGQVVYQWIPPQKPQSLGILKDRIDLEYKATGDPRTVYRAMRILNPTSDIAGEYKCFVSTFADEDSAAKHMTVFEPESSLMIWNSKPREGSINFTCSGEQSYPAPKLTLYKDQRDSFNDRYPLPLLQWDTSRDQQGKYSAFIVANTLLDNVKPGSLIHCELRLPGTGYVKRKSTLYYPAGVKINGLCIQLITIILLQVISTF